MTRKYFGTDGIRGRTNASVLTPEIAMKAGMAAGRIFTHGAHRHRVVIGKDTRLSGYMIESALVSGFTAVGMDVFQFGPLPTPAVAMMTRSLRADLGVMITASHNPYHDNGIKFFGPDGQKLSDDVEMQIEKLMDNGLESGLTTGTGIGRAKRVDDSQARYIEFAKRTFPRNLRLDGLRIVIDCAHGAAYKVAPEVLWELGADMVAMGVTPDGTNINLDCGSTDPAAMCAKVREVRADFGIALDGDADRVVMSDEHGRIIDGDQILALIAKSWSASGQLKGGGVVGTVMSNAGLDRYLRSLGLGLARAPVGDRYVLEEM
jgi:phosphoglucosamine mutase